MLAHALKEAAIQYLVVQGYSCFTELGLCKRGRLRADVVALNLKQHIVLVECKSSIQDFRTDTKWHKYLPFCHKMYFCFDAPTYNKLKVELKTYLAGTGCGVMVVNAGKVLVKRGATSRTCDARLCTTLVTRMAWRGGISKRTTRRLHGKKKART